jgi:hypothetical protein
LRKMWNAGIVVSHQYNHPLLPVRLRFNLRAISSDTFVKTMDCTIGTVRRVKWHPSLFPSLSVARDDDRIKSYLRITSK